MSFEIQYCRIEGCDCHLKLQRIKNISIDMHITYKSNKASFREKKINILETKSLQAI